MKSEQEEINLLDKLQEEKYKNQGYLPQTKVEIESGLFTDFVNILSAFVVTAEKVQVTANSISKAMGYIQEEASKLQIRLAEQHIENIDKGLTVDDSVLDAFDSKEKIQEIKE